MNDATLKNCLKELFDKKNRTPGIILFSSVLLMVTWKFFFSPTFYEAHLSNWFVLMGDTEATGAIYHFIGCFVLLGVIPALIAKFVLRDSLVDYGVSLGNIRRTLGMVAIFLPVFLLFAYLGSIDPSLRTEYPINGHAGKMFALHAATYTLFYLGWEFHFRGYLQMGLGPRIGMPLAMWIQVIASTLLHIGKPGGELFGAIPAAILWGIMVVYTRSLIACLVTHIALGLTVDWLIAASM